MGLSEKIMDASFKRRNFKDLSSHQELRKTLKNNHIIEVDYLRGFAIIAVLLIHTVRYIREIQNINVLVIINLIIDTLAHFAVPLFVFISGFVLSQKYYGQFSYFNFYNKRIKRIIPTYIIISLFYIILNDFYSIFVYPLGKYNIGMSNSMSLKVILTKLLTGEACFHLWFFALIIQLYLIYPLIIKLYENCSTKNHEIILLLFSILCQIMWKTFSVFININIPSVSFFIDNIHFFSYIYYFVLGIYVCKNSQKMINQVKSTKISRILFLIIILTIFNAYFNLYGPEIYGLTYKALYQTYPYFAVLPTVTKPIYYSSIFVVLFIVSRKLIQKESFLSKILVKLGKYSFGIYLIHVFYVYIGYLILTKIGISTDKIIFYPVMLSFVLTFSYISVYCLSYFPYSTLIGIENEHNILRTQNR